MTTQYAWMRGIGALAALCLVAVGDGAVTARAEIPAEISYQGVLSDPLTGPLQGPQEVTFRIFKDATGGLSLWEKTMTVYGASNGLFHAILKDAENEEGNGGNENRLVDAFSEGNRLLEVQVANRGEAIAPRQEFTAVPQALSAYYASKSAVGFFVRSNLHVTVNLTGAKTAMVQEPVSAAKATVQGDVAFSEKATVTGTLAAYRFHGDGIAPLGSIVMWSKPEDQIPSGWVLCNGQVVNGWQTPDLRDRFVVGVGGAENYALGATGGENQVTLTVDQIPSHTHTYTTASDRSFNYAAAWHGSDWWHNDASQGTTGATGGGAAHENRPPYYALYFIMRVN